jgi:T5orf172 domain
MPGLVKIGHTTQNVEARIRQLNSTGVPSPFILHACFHVANARSTEAALHKSLARYRYAEDREFFKGTISNLLKESQNLLFDAMEAPSLPDRSSKTCSAFDLDEESINLLCFLTGEQRTYGYAEYAVVNSSSEPELKTEARLANLKQIKLVTETRSRKDWQGSIWRISSEGKKFLFDNALVTDEMLRN